MMKNVTTQLSNETISRLEQMFESAYAGLKMSAESFLILRRFAQDEIKGIFNENELKALVDMHNATIFDPSLAMRATLKIQIEDSELYDGTLTKWNAGKDDILKKVDDLTNIQAFFIILECYLFWYSAKTDVKDLNQFVSQFTK